MKKVIVYCFALVLMTFVGCQKEELHLEETATATKEITQKGGYETTSNAQSNELVILYPEGTSEAEKELKRAEYNVESYKKCECADPNLELWSFGKEEVRNGGGIETKRQSTQADEEIEGSEYNPNIKIQEDLFVEFGGTASTSDGIQKRVAANQGVTIAVLDTGVDYNYEGFINPFLYNSSTDGCNNNGYQEEFGWNFVDNDNNPFDNHYGRHGTIVTSLITSKLEAANVNYQILPVKVANRQGNIKYFDALCGFQYAANKPDVSIINMSFGWYQQERELLEKFIEDAEDILVITSAGNKGINNDTHPHYPSSYESDNILAVAALSNNTANNNSNVDIYAQGVNGSSNSALADFSNRGILSVDIAASGENIPFTYNNDVIYISGTSYSAALTSGFSGTKYINGMTGIMLKEKVLENAIYDPQLFEIQYSKHIPE
ncbi:MAG: S8 family serine peptidase [Kordia sp.]|uniref:S8 family serine peptidase n=1 Tax=Kordia sp. TaxID=1965332 RepID=UPI00385AF38E